MVACPILYAYLLAHLGTTTDYNLKFSKNCAIFRKGQQRLHCLRKLRSFKVDQTILTLFYGSFIQSVLTFSMICWCSNVSVSDKNKLQKLVNICSKITDQQQPSLANVYDRQVLKKAKQILKDDTHFLFSEYDLLPPKKRFRIPVCQTNRRRHCFIPASIRLSNNCSEGVRLRVCARE